MIETGQESREAELIAAVGMAGRFPGARSVRQLWRNLKDGVESITFFSLLAAGVDAHLLKHPSYVKARGVVEGYDCFDASFFGFSNSEAALLDPQDDRFAALAALGPVGQEPHRLGSSLPQPFKLFEGGAKLGFS